MMREVTGLWQSHVYSQGQRYTIMADKKEGSKHGYVVSKIRLYKKNDMKVSE